MIRIGIICPSEIAFRRFLPALQKVNSEIIFVGVAIASAEEWFGDVGNVSEDDIKLQQECELKKAKSFIDNYGGKIYSSYKSICESNETDALYIPLPPSLHYKWARFALDNGKHVLMEKPFTTEITYTDNLIEIANNNNLALHENYMFIYHNQLNALDKIVKSGEIGVVRLFRISFGFPMRAKNDFRYNKELGGGALLDAGGYCLKYASYLLGDSAHLTTAQVNYVEGFEVDMYGSATIANKSGDIVQLAFGMDNDYKCEIEIWGSKGSITSNRILTAPVEFKPTYTIKKNQEFDTRELPSDDAFLKSILHFIKCVNNPVDRTENYNLIHNQACLVDNFKKLCI